MASDNCKIFFNGKYYDSVEDLKKVYKGQEIAKFGSPNINKEVAKELNESVKNHLSNNDYIASKTLLNLNDKQIIKNMNPIHQNYHINNLLSKLLDENNSKNNTYKDINKNILLNQKFKDKLYKDYIKDLNAFVNNKNNAKIVKILEAFKELPLLTEDYSKLPEKFKNFPISSIIYRKVRANNSFDYIDSIINERKQAPENLEKVKENFDKLFDLAVSRLKSYTLITVYNTKDENESEESKELNIKSIHSDDSAFKVDTRQKLTSEVKAAFLDISDGYADYSEGVVKIKPKRFMGQTVKVSFDRVYTDLSNLLAINTNNYEIKRKFKNKKDFNTILAMLEMHKEETPYFQFVIDKLNSFNDKQKNAFMTNMNKIAVQHVTLYKTKRTSTGLDGQPQTKTFLRNSKTNAKESLGVVINSWSESFSTSDLIQNFTEDGTLIISQKNYDNLVKEASNFKEVMTKAKREKIQSNKEAVRREYEKEGRKYIGETVHFENRVSVLNSIPSKKEMDLIKSLFSKVGIELNNEAIFELYNKGYQNSGGKVNVQSITSSSGVIGAIINQLTDSEGNLLEHNKNSLQIFKDNYVKSFARHVTKYDNKISSLSYSSGEGKNFYGLSLSKFFMERFNEIKTNPDLLEQLLNDEFSENSYIIDLLYDKDKKEFKNNAFDNFFDYGTIDVSVEIADDLFNAKALNKSSSTGFDSSGINLFMNSGNKIKDFNYNFELFGNVKSLATRNSKYLTPTFSDKKTLQIMNSLAFKVEENEEGKVDKDNTIYDLVIQQVILPEYKRILKHQDADFISNKDGYQEGAYLFYSMPEFNTSEADGLYDIETNEEGFIVSKRLKDFENNVEVQNLIKKLVVNHVQKEVEETIEEWTIDGIIKEGKMTLVDSNYAQNNTLKAEIFVTEYVANYLINNSNYNQLFASDIANYFKGSFSVKSKNKSIFDDNYLKNSELFDLDHYFTFKNGEYYNNDNEVISESDMTTYRQKIDEKIISLIKSTKDNYGKRLAAQIAPGFNINPIKNKTHFKVIVAEDIENLSFVKNDGYKESLNKSIYKDLLGKDYYDNMAAGDAMGYSTREEFLNILIAEGYINESEKKEVIAIDNRDNINEKDFNRLNEILSKTRLNSLKPVYYNNFEDGVEGRRNLYIKYSLMPLFKHLTKGTSIDNLRIAMERDGIDQVVYKSGVKSGSTAKKAILFDKDGNFKEDLSFASTNERGETVDEDFVITAPRNGYRMQLENPTNKLKITDGSQQRKLIYTDLLDTNGFINPESNKTVDGNELKDYFNSLYSDLFKAKYNKFLKDIGYNEKTNEIDRKKLAKILEKEFSQRGANPNFYATLGLQEKDGKITFKNSLWTSNLSSKIESIFVSLIDNNLRQHKLAGGSYVLASNLGFNKTGIKEGEDASSFMEKNSSNIVYDKSFYERGDFKLRGQHTDPKTGKVLGAEVILPLKYADKKGNLIDLKSISKDGFIDASKVPDELLEMFGYRIPTQGQNSMSFIKVVGFLPPTYSDIILAPAEFTIQMGSDFDIDKLFVDHFKLKVNEDGSLAKEDNEDLQRIENKILETKLAFMKNPDKSVQSKIITPLDENKFISLADEMESIYKDTSNYSPISARNFRNRYLSASTGNEAIGIFANASTLNSLMQRKAKGNQLYFYYTDENDSKQKLSTLLGSYEDGSKGLRKGTTLSNKDVHNSEKTKGQILSDLITLAVDNENLQALNKLNINKHTYNFVVGMVMSGYNESFIVNYINQPIVRRYVELMNKASDKNVSTVSRKDVFKILANEFNFGRFSEESFEKNKKTNEPHDIFAMPDFYISKEKGGTNKAFYDRYKNVNETQLKQFIVDKDSVKGELTYGEQQASLLNAFYGLNEGTFKTISKLQDSLNIDGFNGIGSTFSYMSLKLDEINSIRNLNINDVDSLLGEFETIENTKEKEIQEKLDNGYYIIEESSNAVEVFKPTTIVGNMYYYGLIQGSKMFNQKDMFPYNNPEFKNKIERVRNAIVDAEPNFNTKTTSDSYRKAINSFKSFLYTKLYSNFFNAPLRQESKRLLSDSETPSLASILSDIKAENNDLFHNNVFLNSLEFYKGSNFVISNIVYDAMNDINEVNQITHNILNLFNDNTIYYDKVHEGERIVYRGKDIVLDLIRYQFLKGGVQYKKQFISLVPNEIFEAMGIDSALTDNVLSKADEASFYTQHMQNNISHVKDITYALSMASEETVDEIINEEKDGSLLLISNDNLYSEEIDPIYKYNNQLFAHVNYDYDTNSHTFKRIPEAGDKNRNYGEYDYNQSYIKESIVPFNNFEIKENYRNFQHNEVLLNKLFKLDTPNTFLVRKVVGEKVLTYKEFQELSKDPDAEFKLIAYTDEDNRIHINDFPKFAGTLELTPYQYNRIGTGLDSDYILKTSEGKVVRKSYVDKAKIKEQPSEADIESLNTVEGIRKFFKLGNDNKQDLKTVLNFIGQNYNINNDVLGKYTIDTIIESLDKLFNDNPNLKFNIISNSDVRYNGKVVKDSNNNPASIIINLANITNIGNIIDGTDSNNDFGRTLIEETLHAITANEVNKDNSTLKELESLRLETIDNLTLSQQKEFKKYKEKMSFFNIQNSFLSLSSKEEVSEQDVLNIFNSLPSKHKESEVYKTILEDYKNKENKDDLDINNLIKSYQKIYNFNSTDPFYHAISNVHEFSAGLIKNTSLQKFTADIKTDKSKLNLFERFMSLLVKVLQRIKNPRIENRLISPQAKPNTILSHGLAKMLNVLKDTKELNNIDLKTLTSNVALKINNKDLNQYLGFAEGKALYPVENSEKIAKKIQDKFENLKVHREGNYIYLTESFEDFDFNDFNKIPKDLKEQQENRSDSQKETDNNLDQGEFLRKDRFNGGFGDYVVYEGQTGILLVGRQPKLLLSNGKTIEIEEDNIEQELGSFPLITKGKNKYIITNNGVYDVNNNQFVNNETFEAEIISEYKKDNMTDYSLSVLNGEVNEVYYSPAIKSDKDVENMRKTRLSKLLKTRKRRIKNQIDRARTDKDNSRFRFYNYLLDNIDSKTKYLDDINSLEDLKDFADSDIQEISEILNRNDLNEADILYSKTVLEEWSRVFEIYFSKEELEFAEQIANDFSEIISLSNQLIKKANDKNISIFENKIQETQGRKIDLLEYMAETGDVGKYEKEGLDISRYGNRFLNYIHQINQEAFNQTKIETYDNLQKVEELIDKAIPELEKFKTKENGLFDILFRKYSDGTLDGSLISPLSKEFENQKYSFIKDMVDADSNEKRNKASNKLNEWLVNNTTSFDIDLLFSDNKEKVETEKERLKSILGEDLFNYFYSIQEEKIEQYEELRSQKLNDVLVEYKLDTKKDLITNQKAYNEYHMWVAENSPYLYHESVYGYGSVTTDLFNEEGILVAKPIYNKGYDFLVTVPKEQENYDNNFQTILNNEPIFEFFKEYRKVLNDLSDVLPENIKRVVEYNGLPDIKKSFIEAFQQEGMGNAGKFLYNTIIEEATSNEEDTVDYTDASMISGEESRFLKFNIIKDNTKEFQTYYDIAVKEYYIENKTMPLASEFRPQIRKEFDNMIAKRKSKDLGKMLKAYVGLTLTYKHKSKIQDTITAGQMLINNLNQTSFNKLGQPMKESVNSNKLKELPVTNSYVNMKEAYQHYMDAFFDNPYKKQLASEKKLYTTAETKQRDKIVDLIEEFEGIKDVLREKYQNNEISIEEYNSTNENIQANIDELQDNLKNIGANIVGSKLADSALKFSQLKGMGWNILAGIGNLGFGYTSLLTEAADGRVINKDELTDAMKLTLNSVGRNLSFHKYDGKGGVALKIRNLMDRNDVLKEASHELYSNSVKGTFAKKLRFLHPYNMQKRTEYLVQSPIMIAMFKKTKHTLEDGNEISLWEGYNNKGQWNTEKFGPEPIKLINKTNGKITQLIKRTHGNYDPTSPIMLKRGILGRTATQFKTWFFEGFAQRWENEKFDDILEVTYKGRYRTFPVYFKELGAIGGLLDLFKAISLNIIGKKTSFENGKLNEVDSANMRKIVTELTMYLKIYGTYLLFSALMGEDDDEVKKGFRVFNAYANTSKNISSELLMYSNPVALNQMAKSPFASTSIVDDIARIFTSFFYVAKGENEIKYGKYAGETRLGRATSRAFPISGQYQSTVNKFKEEFDN